MRLDVYYGGYEHLVGFIRDGARSVEGPHGFWVSWIRLDDWKHLLEDAQNSRGRYRRCYRVLLLEVLYHLGRAVQVPAEEPNVDKLECHAEVLASHQ